MRPVLPKRSPGAGETDTSAAIGCLLDRAGAGGIDEGRPTFSTTASLQRLGEGVISPYRVFLFFEKQTF